MATLDFSDIQGFLLTSYASNMPCANYLLLTITDAPSCRKWLTQISGLITTGKDRKSDFSLNIAFTAPAFKKLGITANDLQTFSAPFQEGMSTAVRQQLLGDSGNSAPDNWSWGNAQNPVDILLLLFANGEEELGKQVTLRQTEIKDSGGVTLIKVLGAGRQPDSKEHFGFLDGIGQPIIEGTGREAKQLSRTGHATVIKAGEFILGHENEMLKPDPLPVGLNLPAFGMNGTYLVFRQLEQHVHQFWQYIDQVTRDASGNSVPPEQDKLGAKIVGRWKSGAPVTTHPHTDPEIPPGVNQNNNFSFAKEDDTGLGCPIGAHIRRTNPRDSLFDDPEVSLRTVKRHRIIRRGRSYGDRSANVFVDDGKERGLHFICLNSNIERQFEFMQQSWSNNPSFSALNNETDPLIGQRNDGNVFSIPACPVRTRIHDLPEFVTTKGGAYFFMPGMKALNQLAGGL
ncbi:Dyp-type peroxidase [Mucilaginibacter sp. McL0603]|uniref:Dyp-type peroxidase n=1 Tax=Mucilaginibacter sp. McL0603 TaxID=3415670 RepID=UPI003CEA63B5